MAQPWNVHCWNVTFDHKQQLQNPCYFHFWYFAALQDLPYIHKYIYILLDIETCGRTAVYFYELCSILASPIQFITIPCKS